MPPPAAGRITGYETMRVLKKTGQRRRMWIGALPNAGSRQSVIAVLLKEATARRVVIPWRCEDASSPVIGSADAHLMVERVSCEVCESLGYRPEETAGTSLLALMLMAGDRVSSIARALLLSEGTIRSHLSSAFGKLGVGTQQELIELLRPTPADLRVQGGPPGAGGPPGELGAPGRVRRPPQPVRPVTRLPCLFGSGRSCSRPGRARSPHHFASSAR